VNNTVPQYAIVEWKDVMIPMRDGVRLAADIYQPARDGELLPGPFPTILMRTSYDKTAQRYVDHADYFTPRGYVVVLQDLRGRYRSEGKGQYYHMANEHEGQDGYDTIEWIAGQPWSNGRVGMAGSSHVGLVQTQAALYRPPHLTSIWPDVTAIKNYDQTVRMGGAMQLHMFGALFLHAQDSKEAQDDTTIQESIFHAMEHMRELVYSTPFKPGRTPLAVVPTLEKTLFDYYYRGEYDEYWSAEFHDPSRHFVRHADIPGTYTSGWYDSFAEAAATYFAVMSRQNSTPQRLILGPWTHMGMRLAGPTYSANDVDFGPEAVWGNARYFAEQSRWFDRWLRDMHTAVDDDPPVHIFVMGGGDGRRTSAGKLNHGGHWRAEREWPLARTQYTTYHLRRGGGLTVEPPAVDEAPARFMYDPAHPVPTIGGTVTGFFEIVPLGDVLDPFWVKYLPPWARMRQIIADGPMDQVERAGIVGAQPPYLPLGSRPDVLAFETPPLQHDVEVTGVPLVTLWVSSSAVDTDFTAKLIDVHPANEDYPAGYAMNLCDAIIRCRYRNSFEKATFMEPGEVYAVTIKLPPTSNLFGAGHRIRVDISSSNFPRFDLNPNTGEPMGRHTHVKAAHNTVYLDAVHPSHIVLPMVPGRAP
jgi:putative CocE/NonD family hydrolase